MKHMSYFYIQSDSSDHVLYKSHARLTTVTVLCPDLQSQASLHRARSDQEVTHIHSPVANYQVTTCTEIGPRQGR